MEQKISSILHSALKSYQVSRKNEEQKANFWVLPDSPTQCTDTSHIDRQLKKSELIRPEIELILYNSFFLFDLVITFFLFTISYANILPYGHKFTRL